MISISKYLTLDGGVGDVASAVRAALDECMENGDKELFFPEGTYHFNQAGTIRKYCFISNNDEGVKDIGFHINGFEDFTIRGENAKLIFHGRVIPFILKRCRNLILKGFTIDFDRPFISNGIVADVRKDYMDLRFSPDEVYFIKNDKIYFFDDEHKFARPFFNCMEYDVHRMEPLFDSADSYITNKVVELERGLVRFYGLTQLPRKGNTIVLKHELRLTPGIVVDRSTNVKIDSVTVHHAGGMGIIAQNSENITLDKVVVGLPEDEKRLISTTDDALHFSNCRGDITINDCVLKNQWDDGVNIHGIYRRFRKRDVGSLSFYFLEAAHHQQCGIEIVEPGEVLEFINTKTLLPYHTAKVKTVKTLNKQITQVEFEEPLPAVVRDGDCVSNLSASPNTTIRGCVFAGNKPRGVLVTTRGKVLIEKNRFHTSGAAIYISGDANFWFESSGVVDVEIIDNVFDNCNYMKNATGSAVVDICPEIADEFLGAGHYHNHIRVDNNTFNSFDAPLVNAKSVELLEFRRNKINASKEYPAYAKGEDWLTYRNCGEVVECSNEN